MKYLKRIQAFARKLSPLLQLSLINLYSRRSIVGDGESAVSLTTYGARLRTVHLAIESIGRGFLRPHQITLWLASTEFELPRSPQLNRLVARGLLIRLTNDYGSHKKYYPYVSEMTPPFVGPLVTADDDALYPREWLRDLEKAYSLFPETIHCHRAHVVGVLSDGRGLAPYSTWKACSSITPSALNFATGVSGILYPPPFLIHLRESGEGFSAKAPKGDDIWLHWLAVENGFEIRQVTTSGADYPAIPRTTSYGLFESNVALGGNDRQISATYSSHAISRLSELSSSIPDDK